MIQDFPDIFIRNQGALSLEQQQILGKSHVAVIGCGGLGGFVIEQLARIGVGRLSVFDPDIFTTSNRNRQLNALTGTLGRNKAQTAMHRVKAIHSHCSITAYPDDFQTVFTNNQLKINLFMDCLDNRYSRRELAELGTSMQVPVVHGAVNGWYGQVGVHLPGDDLIERLYPARAASSDGTAASPPVLSFTVALIASCQSCEAVKLLLGLPSPLHHNWMHIDLKRCEFEVNEECMSNVPGA
jgi:molybdopterin-synthase adenylyltransferase